MRHSRGDPSPGRRRLPAPVRFLIRMVSTAMILALTIAFLPYVTRWAGQLWPDPSRTERVSEILRHELKESARLETMTVDDDGVLTATVQAKDDPKNFHINMVVCGVFAFQDDVSKEELHLETYDELFPHFRSLMMTITAAGGIPPVTPPYIDISGSDIYRFDSGEKK